MPVFPAFLPAVPLRASARSRASASTLSTRHVELYGNPAAPRARRALTAPRMLQSPTGDGPPGLENLADARRATAAMSGPPVALGTERVVADGAGADAVALGESAADVAAQSLDGAVPRVAHVTVGAGVSLGDVVTGVRRRLGDDMTVLARGVPRRDADGIVEVLVLGGGGGVGFGLGEASVVGGDFATAAADAGKAAVAQALGDLGSEESDSATWPTFGMFVATPGGEDGARAGFGGGVPIYGGDGLAADAGTAAGVCVGKGGVAVEEGVSMQRVGIVLLSGKVSFLVSAVVKAWAQPAYVDKLPFLVPEYVGDKKEDLLTAIRYDDWERFLDCLEGDGCTEANVKWETRQHQSPLLAASARARTRMVKYLLDKGADPTYRNDGGFNAIMYTGMLKNYNDELVQQQLKMLTDAGADPDDTAVLARN